MRKRKAGKVSFPQIPAVRETLDAMPIPIITDPNGSYTGRPSDPNERPIQDADDL